MTITRNLLVAAVFSLAPGALAAPQDADQPAGFAPLFNGEDLKGWWGMSTEDPRKLKAMTAEAYRAKVADSMADVHAHWSVEDGVLVNDGAGLFLTTVRDYSDFELLVDYRTVAKADSGIYLRGIPQVQIWDTTKAGGKWKIGADKGSGGLWNNSPGAPGKDPLVHADKPFGEWNRFRIVMIGSYVTIHLNDKLVVKDARLENYFDRKIPIPRAGPIQLQTHGGEIRWRRVLIREIAAAEANDYLRGLSPAGLASVFNGEDLEGWAGAVDDYEVVEGGVIRCKPGKGGTLHTRASYGDFVAALQIKLPPGGNNGLAIRYPGRGNSAFDGMCELQVLDNRHPKYATLDPRQYHGSAYGMSPALRGYQRPTGDWNYQQVTVRGSRITVELNGFEILDTDLSTVEEFMGGKPHPGRSIEQGHFGFAGHSDPVLFRDVRILPLKR